MTPTRADILADLHAAREHVRDALYGLACQPKLIHGDAEIREACERAAAVLAAGVVMAEGERRRKAG